VTHTITEKALSLIPASIPKASGIQKAVFRIELIIANDNGGLPRSHLSLTYAIPTSFFETCYVELNRIRFV